MNAFILKRPVFSEKSLRLLEQHKYTFEVEPKATKGQIKEVIQSLFGVKVLAIKTVMLPAKTKRSGRRRLKTEGSRMKKAIVQIPSDQKIEVFDIIRSEMANNKHIQKEQK